MVTCTPRPASSGHRIDQAAERPRAGQREVVALAEIRRRHELGVEALKTPRHGRRVQAGAVDHGAGQEGDRLGAADLELDAVSGDPAALDRRIEREQRAMVLGIALQREHQAVAVDDAGGRREQRRGAEHLGLQRRDGSRLQPLQVVDAVRRRLGADGFERRFLRRVGGDDELAAARVRHAVLGAIGVQAVLAGDAACAP